MSHKATNWAIVQRGLKPAAKLVLWHLCDRHHPDHGCFPSQETLAEDCEMSRSTLNVHLKALEAVGLIRRVQRIDNKSHRQKSTVYEFPFEFPGGAFPAPENGHGNEQKPCPDFGHGNEQKPCPDDRTRSRVRKTGKAVSEKQAKPCPDGRTLTCKEPVNNQRACAKKPFFTSDELSEAREIAAFIDAGGKVEFKAVSLRVRECLVAQGLISKRDLEASIEQS